jgi:hypothetical protein
MFDVSEINFFIQTVFNVFGGAFSSLLRSMYVSGNRFIFFKFPYRFYRTPLFGSKMDSMSSD